MINLISQVVEILALITGLVRFLGLKASLMLGVELRSKKPSVS